MKKTTIKTTARKRKSLTQTIADMSSDIMSAPALAKVADGFDFDRIVKAHFPRTLESVVVKDENGNGVRSTLTEVMDGCIVPNDPQQIQFFNQLNPRNALNDKVYRMFEDDNSWIGWMACAVLAQHPIISRCCSIPGEDAIAVGYKIHFDEQDGNADEEDKFAKELMRRSKKMGLNQVCRRLDANKRVFGIGICVPCFEASSDAEKEYIDKLMENPLNWDAIRKGRLKYMGMKVVDPYWLCPIFDDASGFDPTSIAFYEPTWWQVGSTKKKIHKSWCIKVVNTIVSDLLKPTYYYGGVPLPQMLMKRMYSADKVADEAQMLAMSKRLLVVDANVQKLVANPKEAAKIMDALKFARDNWGVFFKNPNTNVQQVDTYITEFNQLIMTQYQLVASIAQIPAPKLLKVMPTGFSDVSELVWKDYAQQICSIQEDEYVPLLEMHYEFLLRLEYGEEKPLEVVFNPVDVPTLMEKAVIVEKETKAAKVLIEQGVLAPEEVREVLRNKRGGEFSSVSEKQSPEAKRKEEFIVEQAEIAAESVEKAAKSGGGKGDRVIKNKIT